MRRESGVTVPQLRHAGVAELEQLLDAPDRGEGRGWGLIAQGPLPGVRLSKQNGSRRIGDRREPALLRRFPPAVRLVYTASGTTSVVMPRALASSCPSIS